MKSGQLIENNMIKIFFLKNHTQNVMKLAPDPFIKKIKIKHISGSLV